MDRVWARTKQRLDSEPSWVYRHYNDRMQVLYVGVALSVEERLRKHRCLGHKWAYEVVLTVAERYSTRREAMIAERQAIQEYRPLHNKTFNGGRHDKIK